MRTAYLISAGILSFLLLIFAYVWMTTDDGTPQVEEVMRFSPGPIHELIANHEHWVTGGPFKAEKLAQKNLVLFFFSQASIQAEHVLQEFEAVREEYGEVVRWIGVHSPRFPGESESSFVLEAMNRLELDFPVMNDSSFSIWNAFGIRAWPTVVVVSPLGTVEGVFSGERIESQLVSVLKKLEGEYEVTEEDEETFPTAYSGNILLRFPERLIYRKDYLGSPLLVVSDTGNHRVLGFRMDGRLLFSIGKKGERGSSDGPIRFARFDRPKGLYWKDNCIYVADSGNHLLRKIDLNESMVETLAGNGERGYMTEVDRAQALNVGLSSPSDIFAYPNDQSLVISMAGSNQVFRYHLEKKTLSVLAGQGGAALRDGAGTMSLLSQPAGLFRYLVHLYVVDSGTSALRRMAFEEIETLVGNENQETGYVDGNVENARMQFPTGIYADKSGVYLSDSLNHVIRRYDHPSKTLFSLTGTGGESGYVDGDIDHAKWYHPTGLYKSDQKLFVADTFNHVVREVDLAQNQVRTLGLFEPVQEVEAVSVLQLPAMQVHKRRLMDHSQTSILSVIFEKDLKLHERAPSLLSLLRQDNEGVWHQVGQFSRAELVKRDIELPQFENGVNYQILAMLYVCQAQEKPKCYLQSHRFPVLGSKTGDRKINLKVKI